MNIKKEEILPQINRAMQLSDEHFNCRSLGHSWVQVLPFVDSPLGIPECFWCRSCTMFRIDVVSKRFGELLGRRYIQPDGYYQQRPEDGSRSFSSAAFRAARARRTWVLDDIRPEFEGGADRVAKDHS